MAKGILSDLTLRKQALECFKAGKSFHATSSLLGLNRETVRQWLYCYRLRDEEGFMSEFRKHKTYSYETKIAAVKDFYEQGLSKFKVLEKYQIKSIAVLKAWFRLFNQGGYEALKPKKRGRPIATSQSLVLSREDELLIENRRLKAELDILKKVIALRSSQTAKKQ